MPYSFTTVRFFLFFFFSSLALAFFFCKAKWVSDLPFCNIWPFVNFVFVLLPTELAIKHSCLRPVVLSGLFHQIRLRDLESLVKFFEILVIWSFWSVFFTLTYLHLIHRRTGVIGNRYVAFASSCLRRQILFGGLLMWQKGRWVATIHIVFPSGVVFFFLLMSCANLDVECSRCPCLACVLAERSVKSICGLLLRIIWKTMGTFPRRAPGRDAIVTATAEKTVVGELRTINRARRGDVIKPCGSCWHLVVINSDVIIGGVTWKRFLLKLMSESVTWTPGCLLKGLIHTSTASPSEKGQASSLSNENGTSICAIVSSNGSFELLRVDDGLRAFRLEITAKTRNGLNLVKEGNHCLHWYVVRKKKKKGCFVALD